MKRTTTSCKLLLALAVTSIILFTGTAALAWNDLGHMAVAYVAYKNLTPKTRDRVNALLKLNPYYGAWKNQLNEAGYSQDLDTQIFMLAATWPDLIKKDPNYISDGASDGNRPEGPDATKNIGYSDKLMHKYWHFCDLPFSVARTHLPQIPTPNALTQITAFRKVLASKASDDLKSYDLCWLLHMVGDVHQPLHCATRVSDMAPFGDNGGNDVFVNYAGNKMRMHWFWDSSLGGGDTVAAKKVVEAFDKNSIKGSSDLNAKHWLNESLQLSKNNVYVNPIRPGNGPFDITDQYREDCVKLSKQRVQLAGERLASILNKELK